MKTSIAALLLIASFACAENVKQSRPGNSAYGYLKNIGIPLAEEIRLTEQKLQSQRIIGGVPANPAEFPYQAGLLSSIIGLNGFGVCGGSLISPNRVLTAAHCWYDGVNQAWSIEVVLGSNFLFTGGTRVQTSAIAVHPNWFPLLIRNDIAVIYLPSNVPLSSTISTIALPVGPELLLDFVGTTVVASGFGRTVEGGSIDGNLNRVSLEVISNNVCRYAFPLILQDSNICTSGIRGGTCQGDSGGALAGIINGVLKVIGVVSFGSGLFGGCDSALPAAYARVPSFNDFILSHL